MKSRASSRAIARQARVPIGICLATNLVTLKRRHYIIGLFDRSQGKKSKPELFLFAGGRLAVSSLEKHQICPYYEHSIVDIAF